MSSRTPASCLLLLPLLAGAAVAQGPATILADDPVVLRIVGPERMRAAFRTTNVSDLLGSREAGDFWDLLGAALRDDAHRLRADAGVVDALVERLDGYGGVATVALVPHRMTGMRLWADGVLALEPDGRTDLATIARDVRRLLTEMGWRAEDVELGGATFPVVRVGVADVALPTMVDGRLVVLFGRDLEQFVTARIARGGASFTPDHELEAAPIALRADLRALAERRVLLIPPFALPGPDSPYARLTGLASLRELRVLIRPCGPHVGLDVAVRFAPGVDRGALGVLVSRCVEPAAAAGLIPADVAGWFAGALDAEAFFDACLSSYIAGALGRDAPDRAARVRELIDEELGVDLERDVLARLEGSFVVVEPRSDPGASRGDGSLLAVARVREGEDLEPALVSVARWWWGAGRSVEPSEEGGPRIHRAGDVALSVAGDLALFAMGDDPEALLRDYVTRRRRRAGGADWPTGITRRWPQAPPGVQACGALDVARVLAPDGLRRFRRFLPLPEQLAGGWAQAIGALEPHLEPFHADRAAVFAGSDGEVWVLRLLW